MPYERLPNRFVEDDKRAVSELGLFFNNLISDGATIDQIKYLYSAGKHNRADGNQARTITTYIRLKNALPRFGFGSLSITKEPFYPDDYNLLMLDSTGDRVSGINFNTNSDYLVAFFGAKKQQYDCYYGVSLRGVVDLLKKSLEPINPNNTEDINYCRSILQRLGKQ